MLVFYLITGNKTTSSHITSYIQFALKLQNENLNKELLKFISYGLR